MRTYLIIAALALGGCGQPITRAEFERTHPWCSGMEVIPATAENGMIATVAYPDKVPRIAPGPVAGTGTYYRASGIHVLRYDQKGVAVGCRWQDDDGILR